ncbi:glycoside hydrolase family 79 protein [Mycena latifolia]|nr:glycoside hydrolase family 79 protein [Mycena latifolia]
MHALCPAATMLPAFSIILIAPLVLGVAVTIPLSVDGNAPSVTGNLVSLSIEQDRWLDWAGNTTRNSFFFNTLDNLVALTGAPPTIRIGADSEDHTQAIPSLTWPFSAAVQFVQQVFPPPTTTVPYPKATNIVVGPGFYQGAKYLPPGTGVTWGVNFGGKNLTAVFLETQAIVSAFSSPAIQNAGITLDFLELGNEADIYKNNGLRASTYSVSQYTTEWISFATNMSRTANLAASNTRIWGGAFAESSHSTTSGFSPQGIFANGILDSEPGAFINTISQHHYSGSFCSGNGGLLQELMTKSTIRSNLSSFIPDIQATQDQDGDLDYVLGETNSYSCHGAPGVSNTAAFFVTYRSQLGISKVFFHQGIGYKYNLIQPAVLTRSTLDGSTLSSPLAPHVQPQYYAAIIAAEAIGDSGQTQTVELSINNTRVSGFAFYEGRALKRAVFINSLAFFAGAMNRTSIHLDLSFSGSGTKPTSFSVKRLIIGHADDASGLTWGGQTYETTDARVGGTATSEKGTVSSGIDIPATQVVMISF